MRVEQIDIFEYLEQLEKEEAARAATSARAPRTGHVPQPRRDFVPSWVIRVLKWLVYNIPLLFIFQWVNVYTITRGFGGRENGGWYYKRFVCEESRLVYRWEAEALKLKLERQFSGLKWGQISAESYGQDVMVCIENRKAARQTVTKPTYEPGRIKNKFILEG
jgi:hypothetical protein